MSTASWTRDLEALTTQIQMRSRSQRSLLERTNAAGDVERAKTLLRKFISQNAADVNAAKLLIKRLNDECAAQRSGRLIQITRALGASLQSAIEESNTLEARLIERVRELETHKASRHAALHRYEYDEDNDDNGEAMTGIRGGDDEQEQLVVVAARSDSDVLTEKLFEAAFQERNVEITQLVEGVHEINLIMQDLNAMVIEQGEKLEEIEDNVMSAHHSAVNAAEHLRKGKRWQDDSGKLWVLVAACIFIVVLVLAALVSR